VDVGAADEVERLQRQLVLFAEDLQTVVAQERRHRSEADAAYRELTSAYLGMIRILADVCEAKDPYTRGHLDRTYQFAMALTRRAAPEYASRAEVGYGYLLHDIGKVGVPEGLLNKPGRLDDDEWAIMRSHPVAGVTLVAPLKLLGDAVEIIRSHHERWDGAGYPAGLRGEQIYLPARIFALADTFDAMTTDRPYRRALPIHAALEEIEDHAGTQFDPELARAWVELVEEMERADGALQMLG
jgi:HD-GYP domain-containing protein (c-di-GMP phosphodiesterase class II)